MNRCRAALLIFVMMLRSAGAAGGQPVDASTLDGKLVVGFQGWFMCPGDGRPGDGRPGDGRSSGGWVHWFTANRPDAAHAHFDLLPDRGKSICGSRGVTGRIAARLAAGR